MILQPREQGRVSVSGLSDVHNTLDGVVKDVNTDLFPEVGSRKSRRCSLQVTSIAAGSAIDVISVPEEAIVLDDRHGCIREVRLIVRCCAIEVGQPVARLPPHRSWRAELPHQAPQSDSLRT